MRYLLFNIAVVAALGFLFVREDVDLRLSGGAMDASYFPSQIADATSSALESFRKAAVAGEEDVDDVLRAPKSAKNKHRRDRCRA